MWVKPSMEKQLARFLRLKRGEATFAAFSKRLGIPASTLCRLEQAQQSISLGKLECILRRLNCALSDVFPGW